MRHLVLLPFGSAGDVFPFIWLGKLMVSRGFRVTIITTCVFEDAVKAAGMDFVGLGTIEEIEGISKDPRLWKLGIGTKLVLDHAVAWSERYLEAIEEIRHIDLLMAPLTAFGARLAREKHGLPLISVHLQPMVLISAYDTPVLHPWLKWLRGLPVWTKRFLLSLPNGVDLFAMPGIRKICRSNGVKPPRSLWREWWSSPDGVLLLFPEWFGRPQPDWPSDFLQWDFPLEDLKAELAMQDDLKGFLSNGEPPAVFTPGSANVQAEKFFASAVEAVKSLGIRAVFVTKMENQVPEKLKGRIMQVDFVPFSLILEHTSVFVHHGGVGTMAQGFRAGIPQLIMAMSHDQPDNADRLEKLGAGIGLSAKEFTPKRVTDSLNCLIGDPSFRDRAEELGKKLKVKRDSRELAEWIERRLPSED